MTLQRAHSPDRSPPPQTLRSAGRGALCCALSILLATHCLADVPASAVFGKRAVGDSLQDVQKQLQRLNEQMAQLPPNGPATAPGPAWQQQLAQIERSQKQLGEQLGELQAQSQQEMHSQQALQSLTRSHRQLIALLWLLAGAGAVMLLLLWRQRRAVQTAAAAAVPVVATPPVHEALAATAPVLSVQAPEPAPAATPVHEPAFAQPPKSAPAPETTAGTAPAPAPHSAVQGWRSTEQALAQARMGFMQPAPIDFETSP